MAEFITLPAAVACCQILNGMGAEPQLLCFLRARRQSAVYFERFFLEFPPFAGLKNDEMGLGRPEKKPRFPSSCSRLSYVWQNLSSLDHTKTYGLGLANLGTDPLVRYHAGQ